MPFSWLSKWGAGLLQMIILRAAAVRGAIGDSSGCMKIDAFLCKIRFRTHIIIISGQTHIHKNHRGRSQPLRSAVFFDDSLRKEWGHVTLLVRDNLFSSVISYFTISRGHSVIIAKSTLDPRVEGFYQEEQASNILNLICNKTIPTCCQFVKLLFPWCQQS